MGMAIAADDAGRRRVFIAYLNEFHKHNVRSCIEILQCRNKNNYNSNNLKKKTSHSLN